MKKKKEKEGGTSATNKHIQSNNNNNKFINLTETRTSFVRRKVQKTKSVSKKD